MADVQAEAPADAAEGGADAGADGAGHLVLVDGSGFIFRAFHALPPMTRPDGTPVNAVFGFTNMLLRLLTEHVGTHVAVIFDAGRHDVPQRAVRPVQGAAAGAAAGADAAIHAGAGGDGGLRRGRRSSWTTWEADDLIASYAKAAAAGGMRVTIVSSDKDLMQLVGGRVVMQDPIKQKQIGPAEVLEKFGVPPGKVIDVQALMGDSVDNVPGVPGIGPKSAAQLIQEFGDVEGVLAAAPGMKPGKRRDMLIEHAETGPASAASW